MRLLQDFYRYVLPFALSVPDPVIDQYLILAATEFCERTRSWRDIQEFDIAGDEEEIVTVPAQASIFEIESAWFLTAGSTQWNTPLAAVPIASIDPTILPGSGLGVISDKPKVISQVGDGSVIVAPASAGTLRVSTFLKPSTSATALPDFLFDSFAQAIADGALALILMIPGQPYTNPELATVKGAAFNAVCDRHFGRNIRGQQRAPARSRSSFF